MSQAEIVLYATDAAAAIAQLLEESRAAVSRACEGALESLRSASPDLVPAGVRWSMFGPPEPGTSIGGPLVPFAGGHLPAAYWHWLGEREPSLAANVEEIALGTAGESATARFMAMQALGAIDPVRSARASTRTLDELQAAGDAGAISQFAQYSPRSFNREEPLDLVRILARENPERILALLESDNDEVVWAGVVMIERIRLEGGVERLLSILDRPGTRERVVHALLDMGCEAEVTEAFARRLRTLADSESITALLQVLKSLARSHRHARRVLASLLEREASDPGSERERILKEMAGLFPKRNQNHDDGDDDDGDDDDDEDEDGAPVDSCNPVRAIAILDVMQSEGLIGSEAVGRVRRLVSGPDAKPSLQGTVFSALASEGALDGLAMHRRNLDKWFLSLCGRTQGRIQPEAISCPTHGADFRDGTLRFVACGRLYRANLFVDKDDEHAQEVAIAAVLNRILEESGDSSRFLRIAFGDTLAYGDPSAYSNAERRLGFRVLQPVPVCRIELRPTVAECDAAADRGYAIRCFRSRWKTPGSDTEVLLSRDEHGRTALHVVASSNLTTMIGPILEAGLPVDSRDASGLTPLYYAAFDDHVEATLALIDRGANASSCDGMGLTALHVAAKKGAVNVARALLDRGFDVDLRLQVVEPPPNENAGAAAALIVAIGLKPFGVFRTGQTPLHVAAMNNQVEAMELFLDAGAAIDARDEDGRTPLHLAVSYGQEEAADLLRARGASTSILDHEGLTPDERAADAEARQAEAVVRTQEMIKAMQEHLAQNAPDSETGDAESQPGSP